LNPPPGFALDGLNRTREPVLVLVAVAVIAPKTDGRRPPPGGGVRVKIRVCLRKRGRPLRAGPLAGLRQLRGPLRCCHGHPLRWFKIRRPEASIGRGPRREPAAAGRLGPFGKPRIWRGLQRRKGWGLWARPEGDPGGNRCSEGGRSLRFSLQLALRVVRYSTKG